MKMLKTFKKQVPLICEALEMLIAFLIFIGLILSLIGQFKDYNFLTRLLDGSIPFSSYLEALFTLVIGIEFMEMLCRPNAANVLEIIIFLMARHMIIGKTSVFEDFISVISICILCIVRRFLRLNQEKHDEEHLHAHESEK